MAAEGFGVGRVIGRSFQAFFANPAGLAPLALGAAAATALAGLLVPFARGAAPTENGGRFPVAAVEADPLSALAFVALSAVAWLWLSAGVTYGVVSHLRGRKAGGVEILLRSLVFVPNLLLLTLIAAAAAGILFAAAIAVPVVGPMAAFAVGVWLYAAFWVVVPAIVVEGVGPAAGLARSARLTRGRRWRVLGAIAVWFLISLLIDTVLGAVPTGGRTDADAMGAESAGLPAILLDSLAQVVPLGLGAAVAAVGYHDLRAIDEGAG